MKQHIPKEALALSAAMNRQRLSNVAVADHLDVSPGLVSQWRTGRRPVPADKAVRLGGYVQESPEILSAAYAEVQATQVRGNVVPSPSDQQRDERRLDLIVRRLENDVDSLRYALGAVLMVTSAHRPAEASALAKVVRKHVPAKFVRQGYIAELLEVLARGEKLQVKDRDRFRPGEEDEPD